MPNKGIMFTRHKTTNVLLEKFSPTLNWFISTAPGKLLVFIFLCTIFLSGWITFKMTYHPDIRYVTQLFAKSFISRNTQTLYPFFDDEYRAKADRSSSSVFLDKIYNALPNDVSVDILEIYYTHFTSGQGEYDVRLMLHSSKLTKSEGIVTLSFAQSKNRGWTLNALSAYEAVYARFYGPKSADFVIETWHNAKNKIY